MELKGVKITGTGSYVPDKILTNHDLERMVDTSDDWISARTGIKERRIAAPEETTSDMACAASERALQAAGKKPEDLDMIIVATFTPDHLLPNTGCYLQKRLGADRAASVSLEAACSGFLYGLQVGRSMIQTGQFRTVLVVGAEKLSACTDWTDRGTCVLFGDGAGAAVLERTEEADNGILSAHLGADGNYTDLLNIPAGGTARPVTHDVLDQRLNFMQMNGREIFKLAVGSMAFAAEKVMADTGIGSEQIRWLVPHQANTRIIKSVGKRLRFAPEKVFINLDKYGNTSAATIPIALDEIVRGDMVAPGDYILLVAFGGGLTWGAVMLQW